MQIIHPCLYRWLRAGSHLITSCAPSISIHLSVLVWWSIVCQCNLKHPTSDKCRQKFILFGIFLKTSVIFRTHWTCMENIISEGNSGKIDYYNVFEVVVSFIVSQSSVSASAYTSFVREPRTIYVTTSDWWYFLRCLRVQPDSHKIAWGKCVMCSRSNDIVHWLCSGERAYQQTVRRTKPLKLI